MSSVKVGVVFLHGSGGTGPELRSFLDMVTLSPEYKYRSFTDVIVQRYGWLLATPTARKRPYAAAGGEVSNVWVDRRPSFIDDGVHGTYEDVGGANEAVDKIWECVADMDTRAGGTLDAVVVGGFSMGGSTALHLLRCFCNTDGDKDASGLKAVPTRLLSLVKGIFMIGNYLVQSSVVFKALQAASAQGHSSAIAAPRHAYAYPCVLIMHGEEDDLIPIEWGRTTAAELMLASGHAVEVQFKEYSASNSPASRNGVGHEIVPVELEDLIDWVRFQAVGGAARDESGDRVELRGSGSGAMDEGVGEHDDDDDELRSDGKTAEQLVQEEQGGGAKGNSGGSTGAKTDAVAAADHRVTEGRRRWEAGLAERKEAHYERLRQQGQGQGPLGAGAKLAAPAGSSSGAAGGANIAATNAAAAAAAAALSSNHNSSSSAVPPPVPYELEYCSTAGTGTSSGKVRIIYLFPTTSAGDAGIASSGSAGSNPDMVAQNLAGIASRPIFACGGCFDLRPHTKGLETVVTSADPHKTAVEIGKRLVNRINTGSKDMNPCAMQ